LSHGEAFVDLTKTIRTKIVGVTKTNPDGGERQKLLSKCKAGQTLLLIREPKNQYDPNAIMVCTHARTQLGYIDSELAEDMAPVMDQGNGATAQITKITGQDIIGCNIEITWQTKLSGEDIKWLLIGTGIIFAIIWILLKACW
jgi:hypothetical protein